MGLLKDMSLEDKLRWQEEDRLKAISDEKAEKAWTYDQGLEKGKKEGMEKGKQESLQQIVYRMLENGFDLDTIEKATGLPEAEIKKITKRK